MEFSKNDTSEILNYLLNNDFDLENNIENLKSVIKQYQYYYRILHSNITRLDNENKDILCKLKEEKSLREYRISIIQDKYIGIEEELENLKNKKLSITERITGKIKKS